MKFNSKFNQQVVNEHYQSELKKGTNLYGSRASQAERFKNALRYFDFKGKDLLDVGCGSGGFLEYLINKNVIPFAYLGIDPYKEMIKAAKKKKFIEANFICKDYLKEEFESDITVAFSAFDKEFGNSTDSKIYVLKVIEKMINEAKEGIYVTFLSAYKTIDTPGVLLIYPDHMFQWARRFAERIVLDCSYMPHAFSLVVYNRKSNWRKAWEKK